MAQQSGHAARQSKKKKNELKAKEKKLIDAIVRDEDTSNEKLGILRRHPYYKASVAKAKREAEVRKDRAKKGKPPETTFEKATRQRKESDAAKAKAKAEANAKKQKQEQKQKPEKTAAEKAAEFAKKEPKVNQANRVSKEQSDPVSKKDPTEGGRFAFYPGQTSKDLGLMYEVDKNKMSDEVRERIEEAELYEGDSKGGRVGKGKKKKVSQAPRGVRAALRGFKPNIGASKGNKRTRGTGGGWV